MIQPDWIAVDWGTSHCRAWAMGRDSEVLAEARSDQGMVGLSREAFPGALEALVAGWGTAPVIACGMVGSRQGWVEAAYTPVPCAPDRFTTIAAPGSRRVTVVGGVKQANPADVMRGEETQIAGYLRQNPGFDGVLCLPGTHTKWVQISAGEIISFRTAMTGEMYALLSEKSVLRHAVGDGWDDSAFRVAVSDALSRPESLAAQLFTVRAASLLDGLSESAARARLSGLLIGAELASMRPYWLGQSIAIIGAKRLTQIYADALTAQGAMPALACGEEMTRAGLAHLWGALETSA